MGTMRMVPLWGVILKEVNLRNSLGWGLRRLRRWLLVGGIWALKAFPHFYRAIKVPKGSLNLEKGGEFLSRDYGLELGVGEFWGFPGFAPGFPNSFGWFPFFSLLGFGLLVFGRLFKAKKPLNLGGILVGIYKSLINGWGKVLL